MDVQTPEANAKKRSRSAMSPKPEVVPLPELFSSASTTHTVGFGITGPPPQNSRVEVKRFAEVVPLLETEIRSRLARSRVTYQNVNLDVSDLRYRSPDIAIGEAIEEAAKRRDILEMRSEEFVDTVDIPSHAELQKRENEANLQAMEHLKFVRKVITKVRSKSVNYLAKNTPAYAKKDSDNLSGKVVVLSIAVCAPLTGITVQEFLVHSLQPLTVLKDALYCIQDQAPVDLTAAPVEGAADESQSHNTSGFFFIEGTFYNDTRKEENKDYATTIANWMASGASTYWSSQPTAIAAMQDTKFEDLTLQIGKKYLYCHRAKCEHVFIVNSIRALSQQDEQNSSVYPILIYQAKYRQRKCTICDRNMAKWITSGDSFSIEDPSYYCSECYEMAHNNEGGSTARTGFKTLPYLHD